ncbi:MAG TPA: hypothetical protein VMT86_01355 [Bryobacteraceae bacterium]|nr:hypothetical protein [Bryobacteraceae bacterium]
MLRKGWCRGKAFGTICDSMESAGLRTGELLSSKERRLHIERVLGSATFSNAPSLKSFLQYVVSLAEEGRSDEINEYSIATSVFSRTPKFDPASDTIVRTQAYRLRLKLKEYYESEGRHDGITIEVPKGHYVPVFQVRPGNDLQEAVPQGEVPVRPEPISSLPRAARGRFWTSVSGIVLLALVMFIAGAALAGGWLYRRQSALAAHLNQGIEAQFWNGFFDSQRHIIVSFWDFPYLVSEGNVLLPLRAENPVGERSVPAEPKAAADPKLAALAGRLYYENGFAALGDMLALQRLSMLFTNLGATITATRAHQLTLDEMKKDDLVFLGGFQDRGNLIWLPEHWPWRFAVVSRPGFLNNYIADTEAPPQANSHYGLEFDRNSHAIRSEYAMVSVVPGVSAARRVVIVAGLTTSGTQGAAEFLTSETGLRDLLAAIGIKQGGRLVFPRFFQCVVHVEVAHGLDVISTKYVTGAAFQPKP